MAGQWLDELISRLNIVEIISQYVPLTKKGRTWWGCCPFHHEKEPSFSVSEDKQFFYCFGCKESGNVITFIEKIESVEFMDAVKILAKKANYTIPDTYAGKKKDGIDPKKRDRLYSLMRAAGRHYYENLSRPEAKPAIEYMKARELTGKLAKRFALGYSIDGKEIIGFLTEKGYTIEEMKTAGIVEVGASGPYDVFYERLIIPIVNHLGEVVGFGGRLLNPGTHIPVKYRNTSATPIFDKSRVLFALNLVKEKKRREKINSIIIAEGYMDVMMLHKAGFDTAVASMGTSLTFQQAKLVRNYADTVYISYDGDSAGQNATLRGLDILRDAGLTVKVIRLPDGLDPDDLIKQRGPQAYKKLIDESLTLTEYKLENAAAKYDLTTPDGKSAYAIAALKIIGALGNPVEQEEYLRVVIKNTGYQKQTLMKQLGLAEAEIKEDEQKKSERKEAASDTAKKKMLVDRADLFVVASFIGNRDYVDYNADIAPYLSDQSLLIAYRYAIDRYKADEKCNPSRLFDLIDDREEARSIADYEFKTGDGAKKFRDCIVSLQRDFLTKEKKRLSDLFAQDKDYAHLKDIVAIEEKLKSLNVREGAGDGY